jgi:hypothetical protein
VRTPRGAATVLGYFRRARHGVAAGQVRPAAAGAERAGGCDWGALDRGSRIARRWGTCTEPPQAATRPDLCLKSGIRGADKHVAAEEDGNRMSSDPRGPTRDPVARVAAVRIPYSDFVTLVPWLAAARAIIVSVGATATNLGPRRATCAPGDCRVMPWSAGVSARIHQNRGCRPRRGRAH